jgi:hypothetical protein
VVYQPTPATKGFDSLPFFYLAKYDSVYFGNDGNCELCDKEVPLQEVWV